MPTLGLTLKVSKLTCYSISEREKLRTPSQDFSDSHTPLDPDPCFQILCFGIHPVSLQVETHSSGDELSLSARTLLLGKPLQAADLGSFRCSSRVQGLREGNCYQSGQFLATLEYIVPSGTW